MIAIIIERDANKWQGRVSRYSSRSTKPRPVVDMEEIINTLAKTYNEEFYNKDYSHQLSRSGRSISHMISTCSQL